MHFLLGLLKLAIANLRTNKLRSGLTVLGMVFGTAAVIATLSSSEGATRFIQAEMSKLGANTLTVAANPPGVFTPDSLSVLRKYADEIDLGSAILDVGSVTARFGSQLGSGHLVGVEPEFFEATKNPLGRGRLFDTYDTSHGRPVLILGSRLARDTFGKANPLGQKIHLFFGDLPFSFEVIGTVTEKGGQAGSQTDTAAFVPFPLAKKLAGQSSGQSFLSVSLKSEEHTRQAKAQIFGALGGRFPAGFKIWDAREAIERNKAIWEKQNLVGLLLALISLVTGGVGIMNIMLLSVSQRRKEIGLRKAVGATNAHVCIQFLLEAVLVCLMGGALGILTGVWFGGRVAKLMGQWDAVIAPSTVFLAMGFAMVTGIVFGLLPAVRAAQLDPYEALRIT